jgi:hypothetical protein
MDDTSSSAIPIEWADGFHLAVARFRSWRPPEPETEISISRRPYSMSMVCDYAMKFKDALPQPVFDGLAASYIKGQDAELRQALDADPSYATAASCLLKLIAYRNADYERTL